MLRTGLTLLLFLALAPLVGGVIKRIKAALQRRVGPPIWQTYADLHKFFRKDMVIADTATWLTHATPFIYAATTAGAALLVPTVFGGHGDALLMVGLLALGRFVLALAALEPGSAFGGMGASREMAVAVFVEPVLLLTLGVFALRAGTTDLGAMFGGAASVGGAAFPGYVTAAAALMILAVAETGRVPIDNPDTHLELTMIHEGMVLEYSGPYLGLLVWSHDVKQLVMLSLLAGLALPFCLTGPLWLTALAYLAKTLVLAVALAVVETAMAKIRILKIPDLLMTGAALSLLALLSDLRIWR